MTVSHKKGALNAFIGIRRTSEGLLKIAKNDAKCYDLNINEFAVLELLFHKGPSTVQKITEKILIANSSTTYIIDQLQSKGLIFREASCQDRRVCIVNLTDKGHNLIENSFPQHADKLEEAFTDLNEAELKQLIKLLRKVNY